MYEVREKSKKQNLEHIPNVANCLMYKKLIHTCVKFSKILISN